MKVSSPTGINISHPGMLFIGGRWVAPKEGGTIDVVSADTEEVVARGAEAGEARADTSPQPTATQANAGRRSGSATPPAFIS